MYNVCTTIRELAEKEQLNASMLTVAAALAQLTKLTDPQLQSSGIVPCNERPVPVFKRCSPNTPPGIMGTLQRYTPASRMAEVMLNTLLEKKERNIEFLSLGLN
jgi:hypothetical protein